MGVGDLPENVTRQIMDQVAVVTPEPVRPVAARVAQDNRIRTERPVMTRQIQDDEVILRLDRATAVKLKRLLLDL